MDGFSRVDASERAKVVESVRKCFVRIIDTQLEDMFSPGFEYLPSIAKSVSLYGEKSAYYIGAKEAAEQLKSRLKDAFTIDEYVSDIMSNETVFYHKNLTKAYKALPQKAHAEYEKGGRDLFKMVKMATRDRISVPAADYYRGTLDRYEVLIFDETFHLPKNFLNYEEGKIFEVSAGGSL